ncbi:MAG TPA: ribosome small subunit-dependent GTPase A [Pontiellaceae bacterium]|nr:ribosome small subunit-dependent GTPase A [Pontiellaceae bacterium]HPR83414.1 ribosome small subunit-dependent GTPase A [Pontiellaceae bacterium]
MTLEEFGFTPWFQQQVDAAASKDCKPARITAIHKGWCDISDGEETRPAKTTGKLRRAARETKDYLTVGDWVLATNFDAGDFAMIHSVLKRQNTLRRKMAGKEVSHQLIAANIDTAFVVHTLDKGFNLPKLERYLSIVNESGIEPVVLLTKKDMLSAGELKERLAEVEARLPNVPVYAFSNTTGSGLKKVQKLFEPGKTYCLLGASGVGKTSLINSLMGEEDLYFTLPVRECDGKGIHTTTWRELIELDNGALVIDTPGMRELGHLDTGAGIKDTFEELTALEGQCRFRDCAHTKTKGCAIEAAVEAGTIPRARYENFIRMRQETAANERALRQQTWKNK